MDYEIITWVVVKSLCIFVSKGAAGESLVSQPPNGLLTEKARREISDDSQGGRPIPVTYNILSS